MVGRLLLTKLVVLITCSWCLGSEQPTAGWMDSYGAGMTAAKQSGRMLLVYFYDDKQDESQDQLAHKLTTDDQLRPLAEQCVLVRVPLEVEARIGGNETKLIDHPAFAELERRPGLVMIDCTDPKSEYYGHVVSVYPLSLPGAVTTKHLESLLTLPEGSLTQRTLILAVRIHPEGPSSADGTFLSSLAKESESHSRYQARIRLQGHHNWESRFQRISARLPGGYSAQEVCAESWPRMGLVAAALDCVQSWRQSSGHWNAVRSRHAYFGYDMKRGSNGIWYATGIFSTR